MKRIKNEIVLTVKIRCGKRTKPDVDVGSYPSGGKYMNVGGQEYSFEEMKRCVTLTLEQWLATQVERNSHHSSTKQNQKEK